MKKAFITLSILISLLVILTLPSEAQVTEALFGPNSASKNLDKDTRLRPVGWKPGETLLFKKGNVIVDTVEGGVKRGHLAETVSLFSFNSKTRVKFIKDRLVVFERAGGVLFGYLAEDLNMRVCNTNMTIPCAKDGEVEFGYDGGIIYGHLRSDMNLPVVEGGTKLFKAGTTVKFDDQGRVETTW